MSVPISEEERLSFANADTNPTAAEATLLRFLNLSDPFIASSGPWPCFCGLTGRSNGVEFMHGPHFQVKRDGTIIITDNAFASCNRFDCQIKRDQLLEQMINEDAFTNDETNFRSVRRICYVCEKSGAAKDMYKCSRCKAMVYCSKKCQIKHWKAGHKKECIPKNAS